MMTSSFHVPPPGTTAPASSSTRPLAISSRFTRASAKKAIDRLSGDQNGSEACSVPANGDAAPFNGRSHRRGVPPALATNTSWVPSGDIASDTGSVVVGVVISRRISAGGCAGDLDSHQETTAPAANAATSAAAHHPRRYGARGRVDVCSVGERSSKRGTYPPFGTVMTTGSEAPSVA